jgi:hypothetical protein
VDELDRGLSTLRRLANDAKLSNHAARTWLGSVRRVAWRDSSWPWCGPAPAIGTHGGLALAVASGVPGPAPCGARRSFGWLLCRVDLRGSHLALDWLGPK